MSRQHPIRTCVGCRLNDDPAGMIRFVQRDGQLVADPTVTAPGRGAWLHRSAECWDQAVTRRGFARSFRRAIRLGDLNAEQVVGPHDLSCDHA